MQNHRLSTHKALLNSQKSISSHFGPKTLSVNRCVSNNIAVKNSLKSEASSATISGSIKYSGWHFLKHGRAFRHIEVKCIANSGVEEISDEDDELCPVECVKEFKTDDEFLRVLEKSKKTKSLVVVDFYRTACGSCKYIEKIFTKLCKGSGAEEAEVIFLKHNVIDEYDEQSEVAERLRIRVVPLFHFYKDGVLLEAFPTRDKEKIIAAIEKYTTPIPQDN